MATGTAPPYPASVHLTMGNPTGATADIGQPNNYLMEKPEFALSYDRDLGGPNWVSWHLSSEWFGTLTRVDTFRADPAVPADWYRVQSFDFSGSGFDRGHMVPERRSRQGNVDPDQPGDVPDVEHDRAGAGQQPGTVGRVRGLPQGRWPAPTNEIYIVAGGVGMGGTGSNGGVIA